MNNIVKIELRTLTLCVETNESTWIAETAATHGIKAPKAYYLEPCPVLKGHKHIMVHSNPMTMGHVSFDGKEDVSKPCLNKKKCQ